MIRKDASKKVTGQAKYTADYIELGSLYAKVVKSTVAHGIINNINIEEASKVKGVRQVILGEKNFKYCGVLMQDRPILAYEKVRYGGEPIAIVVAQSEEIASYAASLIKADITPLEIIYSIDTALKENATLVHRDSINYVSLVDDIYPEANSNIVSSYKINKGDLNEAWKKCAYIVEEHFTLPQSSHVMMETRAVQAKLNADGTLYIMTSSQAPYTVKELISQTFDFDEGKIQVEVPFVGGGYGGKSPVTIEYLAVLCAIKNPGKMIRLVNSREDDFSSFPIRLGLNANIRMGCDQNGKILVADMFFALDCGAYCGISPNMSKAIAVDCTGPYKIDNLFCNSICVYTNHTYVTAYRGFGHESYTFCLERTIDELANVANIDKLDFRYINAIHPGDLTPTQVEVNLSNTGNVSECIKKLRGFINYDEGEKIVLSNGVIRAKGISCLWKTPNPTSNASAGAIITFNSDGSANLNVGVVEMGNNSISNLSEILALKLRMAYDRIHVNYQVDTSVAPKYWKTVASLSSFLVGKAVINAADDVINQLKSMTAVALRCQVEDLDYGEEKVFLKTEPKFCMGFQDLVFGLKYPDGNTMGNQVIGRGSYIIRNVSNLSEDTGKGKVGHSWTVGAQGVEIEIDPFECTYRLLQAVTVMDVGKVINTDEAISTIKGAMSMGLSLARNEACTYNQMGIMENTSLRNYKVMHIGEEPEYLVEFVNTPQIDAPFGTRVYSEHGIIGMPAALGNAIATALDIKINFLPLIPEYIYNNKGGAEI